MRNLRLCSGAVVLVVALAAVSAHAQQAAPRADEREVKARELFGIGKYDEALEIFGKLYAETLHPTYMRNIGRCYQNLGEPDKAISSFREYLRQAKNLAPDQRALVEGYVAEMEALKRKREKEHAAVVESTAAPVVAPAPAPAPATAIAASDATSSAGNPPAAVVTLGQQDAEGPGSGARPTRIAAYLVGAGGLVAIAVGGVYGLKAYSQNEDGKKQCPMDPCNNAGAQAYSEARSSAHLSDAFIGAGLVGAGVAAYLFWTSRDSADKPSDTVARAVHVLPSVGSTELGLIAERAW